MSMPLSQGYCFRDFGGLKPFLLLWFLLSFSQQSAFADSRLEVNGSTEVTPLGLPGVVSSVASRVTDYFDVYPGYQRVKQHVHEAADEFNIEHELLHALIAKESRFDTLAVSPGGAIGLMQIMPATARNFGVSGDKTTSIKKKLFDPRTNIKTGTRYLQYLINLFPGRLELALAAYNAGEGTVMRAGNKIPNNKGTQHYVQAVMKIYSQLKSAAWVAGRPDPLLVPGMEVQGGTRHHGTLIAPVPALAAPLPPSTLQFETD